MKGKMRKWMLLLAVVSCFVFGTAVSCFASITYKNLNLNDQWVNESLYKGTDLFYKFNVPADGRVTLWYQSVCYDTYWELWTEDMTTKLDRVNLYYASETSPKTSTRMLDLTKGNYCIKIWSSSDNTGKSMSLKGSYASGNVTDQEPNDIFGQAMYLQRGKREVGMFTATDRIDFFKVNITKKSEVSFNVVSLVHDMYLTVYSGDYMELKNFNIYYGSQDSPKTYEGIMPLDPGTYYVKMTPSGSGTGIYYLSYSDSAVSSITLNHSSLKMTRGESGQLSATVLPTDAVNKNVKWSSSDSNVVYVNDSGYISAQSCGQAVVTATAADGTGVKATCTVTVVPGKPSYLSTNVSSAKKDSVQLSWGSVYGASGYRVFKYNAKTKKYEKYKDTSKTTMKVTKLAAETKYQFKVAAYVQIGSSKELGTYSQVCKAYTAPKKISATKITSKKVVKKTSYSKTLQLKWKKVSGATGYRVYRKTGSGSYYLYGTTKKTTMNISLSNRITYSFKVVAYRTKNNLTTDASASKVVKYRS